MTLATTANIANLAWRAIERIADNYTPLRCLPAAEENACRELVNAAVRSLRRSGANQSGYLDFGGRRFFVTVADVGRVYVGRCEGDKALSSGYEALP